MWGYFENENFNDEKQIIWYSWEGGGTEGGVRITPSSPKRKVYKMTLRRATLIPLFNNGTLKRKRCVSLTLKITKKKAWFLSPQKKAYRLWDKINAIHLGETQERLMSSKVRVSVTQEQWSAYTHTICLRGTTSTSMSICFGSHAHRVRRGTEPVG